MWGSPGGGPRRPVGRQPCDVGQRSRCRADLGPARCGRGGGGRAHSRVAGRRRRGGGRTGERGETGTTPGGGCIARGTGAVGTPGRVPCRPDPSPVAKGKPVNGSARCGRRHTLSDVTPNRHHLPHRGVPTARRAARHTARCALALQLQHTLSQTRPSAPPTPSPAHARTSAAGATHDGLNLRPHEAPSIHRRVRRWRRGQTIWCRRAPKPSAGGPPPPLAGCFWTGESATIPGGGPWRSAGDLCDQGPHCPSEAGPRRRRAPELRVGAAAAPRPPHTPARTPPSPRRRVPHARLCTRAIDAGRSQLRLPARAGTPNGSHPRTAFTPVACPSPAPPLLRRTSRATASPTSPAWYACSLPHLLPHRRVPPNPPRSSPTAPPSLPVWVGEETFVSPRRGRSLSRPSPPTSHTPSRSTWDAPPTPRCPRSPLPPRCPPWATCLPPPPWW